MIAAGRLFLLSAAALGRAICTVMVAAGGLLTWALGSAVCAVVITFCHVIFSFL